MSIFGKKTSGLGIPEGQDPKGARPASEGIQTPPLERFAVPPPASSQQPPLVQKAAPLNNPTIAPAIPREETNKSPYTIDDVIRLMRELPDSKKEMVVIIVQKTLMSARIDVSAIFEDAGRKVDKLQKGSDRIVAEIREMEEAIIQKKAEVDRLTRDLEEIQSVKQIFESVYGRHVKGEGQQDPGISIPPGQLVNHFATVPPTGTNPGSPMPASSTVPPAGMMPASSTVPPTGAMPASTTVPPTGAIPPVASAPNALNPPSANAPEPNKTTVPPTIKIF